jgi:hypothetical protein
MLIQWGGTLKHFINDETFKITASADRRIGKISIRLQAPSNRTHSPRGTGHYDQTLHFTSCQHRESPERKRSTKVKVGGDQRI